VPFIIQFESSFCPALKDFLRNFLHHVALSLIRPASCGPLGWRVPFKAFHDPWQLLTSYFLALSGISNGF
jgi:hypothetical protein